VARYGTGDEAFGRANGDFLSRLYVALRRREPRARLLTVGADYSGTADTDYLRGLRATLRPEVEVMWTGVTVPSHAFAPADAAAYGKRIGRRPLVWDNWTDDDTAGNATPAGTARIFLGPYRRRPDVAGAVGGFFLNPMNEADLNLLPLATAGDWLRAPNRYERRRSWLRAVRELAGPLRPVLRAWAETSWSTKLDLAEAPSFVRLSQRFLRAYDARPVWGADAQRLRRELGLVIDAPRRLRGLPNRHIADQGTAFLAAAGSRPARACSARASSSRSGRRSGCGARAAAGSARRARRIRSARRRCARGSRARTRRAAAAATSPTAGGRRTRSRSRRTRCRRT
jgi:hyaluronoglucosaminidase